MTQSFENEFSEFLGVESTIGVSSCTNALFLTLTAWGIGPGDEVIVPAQTFITTANVVLHRGAKPVFVDVEPQTGNIDIGKVEAAITNKTKVIIPVHMYGQMVDMKKLREVSDRHDIKILEDSAHTIEASRDGFGPGQLGDAACFSFYATKNITSGEGGAIATNDKALAETLKILRNHGMSKSAADRYQNNYRHWDMELLGYKSNMNDIQAALLRPQLKKNEKVWQRKYEIAKSYQKYFKAKNIEFPIDLESSKHGYHLFTIWVDSKFRDQILNQLQSQGIGVAVNYRAVPTLSYYRRKFGFKGGEFPIAEDIGMRTISLPFYAKLTDSEVDHVCKTVSDIVDLNVKE